MQHILCLRYLGTVLLAAVLITLSRIVPGTGVLNRQGSWTRSESGTTAASLDTSLVTVESQRNCNVIIAVDRIGLWNAPNQGLAVNHVTGLGLSPGIDHSNAGHLSKESNNEVASQLNDALA